MNVGITIGSVQHTLHVCRTSIQGETTHNARTGPGREEVREHAMRAVCKMKALGGGGWTPPALGTFRGSAGSYTHAHTP